MNINDLYEAIDLQQIDDYIANGQEENLLLDFITVNQANMKGEDDKRNFAKVLSGFANSSGGLIIWGVEARRNPQGIDCAIGKKEISSLRLFMARLNELTGSSVSPIVDGVVTAPPLHRLFVCEVSPGAMLSRLLAQAGGRGDTRACGTRRGGAFAKMCIF